MATLPCFRLFHFDSMEERSTMFIALGLSLSLFGLTTIEALPASSEPLFFSEETLSFAYWIVLWMLSVHIILVVPSLVGSSLGISCGKYLCCASKSAKRDGNRYVPWWIRFAWRMGFGLVFIVFKNIIYNSVVWCCSRIRRRSSCNLPVLRTHNESMKRPPSAEILCDESLKVKSALPMDSSSHKDNEKEYSQVQLRSARQYFFAILGGSCGIMYTLKILSTIGPLVVQPPSEYETNIISLVVSWICALGLLISAVLNGFGSVSLPYANLCGFFLQVRPDYITNLESELKSIESALSKKRRMEKELKVEIPSLSPSKATNRTGSSSNAFSMSSILTLKTTSNGFSELGDELRIRRQILQTEISFMEDLLRETKLDLEELKESQVTAAAARSSMGKNKSYVGILFSVILLVRLLIAGFSIFRSYGTLLTKGYASDHHRHKKPHSDIVTIILLWLTGHNYFSHNQYAMISQMVSLILSAVLSFSQVRLFLRNATIVHRRLSRFSKKCFNGGGAMDGVGSSAKDSLDRKSTVRILWPIISAFLGCYSLACIVLIKMMLPKRFSVAFSKAMGEKGIFTIHSSMVDMVFFSSAVLSAGILGMLLGIQRQNISRHANILTQRGGNVAGNTLPDV